MVDNQYRDRKILVVDDEERMVRFIRLNLEHDGFRVIEAFNGNQAINKARSNLPDLVLLDVMMPDLDGFEVLAGAPRSQHGAGDHADRQRRGRRPGARPGAGRG